MTFLYCKHQIILRPACPGDGKKLAPLLRAEDRAELAASHPGETPADLLESFIRRSRESFFVLRCGRPAALFGVSAPGWFSLRACVWFLTGDEAAKMPVSLVRIGRAAVERFLTLYPELYNFTDERYPAALRFIKRLGGRFDGSSKTCGDVRFLYFTFRRNSWEE